MHNLFVLRSYTMHKLRNQNVSIGYLFRTEQILLCTTRSGPKKRTKRFVGFHNHSPLLTMAKHIKNVAVADNTM